MAKIEQFQQRILDAIQMIEDNLPNLADEGISITFEFTNVVANEGDPPQVDVTITSKERDGRGHLVDGVIKTDLCFDSMQDALVRAAEMVDEIDFGVLSWLP